MAGLVIANPVTWTEILASDRIIAGDTLQLCGGTYVLPAAITLVGAVGNPIIITNYSGEKVIIDGGLSCPEYGASGYLSFRNLEFYYSGWTTRISEESGSAPSDIPNKNIVPIGSKIDFIDCIIHDMFSPTFATPGGDIIGCHIYNNGWDAPDRGHGHGIYSQNGATEGSSKRYAYNIVHDCFGWGIHVWDEHAYLSDYTCEYNISYGAGSLSQAHPNILHGGGGVVSDNVLYQYNLTYLGRGNEFGWPGTGITNLTLSNNYFPDGITKTLCNPLVEIDNYYGPAVGNQIFVFPYKSTIGYVTIYNQAEATSLEVNLSTITGLSVADGVNVHNTQDYDNDIQVLTLDVNKHVVINMQAANRSVASMIGGSAPPTTFPLFGCFIVEKA